MTTIITRQKTTRSRQRPNRPPDNRRSIKFSKKLCKLLGHHFYVIGCFVSKQTADPVIKGI